MQLCRSAEASGETGPSRCRWQRKGRFRFRSRAFGGPSRKQARERHSRQGGLPPYESALFDAASRRERSLDRSAVFCAGPRRHLGMPPYARPTSSVTGDVGSASPSQALRASSPLALRRGRAKSQALRSFSLFDLSLCIILFFCPPVNEDGFTSGVFCCILSLTVAK